MNAAYHLIRFVYADAEGIWDPHSGQVTGHPLSDVLTPILNVAIAEHGGRYVSSRRVFEAAELLPPPRIVEVIPVAENHLHREAAA